MDSVSCEDGKICLAGWAFDEDAYYENLQIIVNIDYIEEYILEANGYRPDVNEAYQNVPGVNHGFEGEIYPAQRGLKNVVIYAVDMGGNSVCDNTILWEGPLEIKDDTTPPTIEDVYIHDIDANGYYIHCIVRDNVGLREVEFPTWTLENKNASGDDQDDIIWGNAGTVSGNGWELDYRVNYSDHKNELDCTYATHIYCYDMSGNEGIYAISQYACNGSVMTSGYGRVIPDGDYIVATACSGSKADLYYLDIVGTDLPANDGTNVALAGPISTLEDPQSYDVWTLTYGSDGFYSIKQKGSEVNWMLRMQALDLVQIYKHIIQIALMLRGGLFQITVEMAIVYKGNVVAYLLLLKTIGLQAAPIFINILIWIYLVNLGFLFHTNLLSQLLMEDICLLVA